MDLTILSTTGRKHDVTKKTKIQTLQGSLQWKTSFATSSNMSIAKKTIKQTVPVVLIGETVSAESSMVENDRSSTKSRVY